MTSTRAVTVAIAAAGALFLTACGGQDSTTEHTGHDASTNSASTATSTASVPPPTSIEATASSAPPPAPTTTVALPPPVTTVPPPAPRTPVAGEIDARSPDQIVADSGERGQRYLAALRGAGIPPTGMDAVEVLYAQGTCDALARGDSRASVLAEFDSVGAAYAQFLPMPADRIAEVYVSTAERTYC